VPEVPAHKLNAVSGVGRRVAGGRNSQRILVIQKHIWEGSIWSLDHWTTEEDVQGLIEESFPIVGTYRKDEPGRTGEAAWTGEVVWNREAVWIGEGHFIFNRKMECWSIGVMEHWSFSAFP